MTDSELIAKFLNGNIEAFNTLVWRWEKGLYNFVLRYIGDRETAKDVCQKSFIRAYQNLHRLRELERFSTWLYQIAVNVCRDELKAQRRRKMISLNNLEERGNGAEAGVLQHLDDAQPHPESQANQRDLRELLAQALQEVPEEQRVVIIMKEYQGLKFTEIAEILETSVNTVKSRMYYGLTALRKVFKQWKIYEEMLKYEM
ncbi:MAG TPA: sigma-70 family RNA polymerase sigma factor [bacterium]